MHRPRFFIPIVAGILATFTLTAVIALNLALSDRPSSDVNPAGGPPLDGCQETASRELYVQRAYACSDGTRVVTFADDQARDAYLTTAESFGTVTIERGIGWARVR
jgi:hypothetical protein